VRVLVIDFVEVKDDVMDAVPVVVSLREADRV